MTRIVDDDEAEIEAEIQRQLDEISAENLEIEDLEDTLTSFETNKKDDGLLPESIEEYLKYVQSRTENIQQEVRECDDFLIKNSSDNHSDEILANRIKEALGDDCHDNPLEIRNKVLSEIEEVEKQEEKERSRRASHSSNMTLDIIRPVISDEVRLLEETAEKQLQELEEKQSRKHQERTLMYEKMKQEENERLEREQNAREMRQRELEEAQNRLNETQKIQREKLEQDRMQEQKELNHLEEIFQKEIKELEEEKEKEKKALEQARLQEENHQRTNKHNAAVVIQKCYRGHRVFVQYREVLQEKKTERLRKHEEELEKKYQEEIARKEAERQSKELQEKMRIEEERLRKEEIWKKEMEEKKRREEERKRKEEEEKKRREEEKKEEEEKKRKEEEERRREEKEKQEQQKRELERKKRENEEQKRKEEEIRRQEEMKKEEERRRQEELEKQKEQLEKKHKEEKRRKELEKEEMRKKEIERKKKEELQRIEEEKKAALERQEMKKIEIKRREQEKDKQNMKEYQEHKQSNDPLKDEHLVSTNPVTSSAHLFDMEELRRKWLSGHTLWSIQTACEDREQPVAKSRTRHRSRRPFSASKNLPQLTKEQILQASPPGTPLHKVIRVSLSSCPACNLHGLDSSPNLKALDMRDCGLLAVEGLDECKELKELILQDNKIEHISIKGLHQLEEVILRNNNLASVQALTDCPQLKKLDLRNNRITRIGDMSTCSNLQIFNLNNNQLITTKGLSNLTKLQSFSCANNHLPDVKEIESCQLLQMLDLTGNNLQKPPSLTNHVLLRELVLDDNSISTLEPLADAWLPSLRVLSVCQNSISDVAHLKGCIMLQSLDIRYNLISDLESLLPGLGGCRELSLLKIAGNPVNEEPQCRNAVIDALLVLTQLDDEILPTKSSSLDGSCPIFTMCHKQLHEYTDMKSKHENQLSVINHNTNDPSKVTTRLKLKSQQFNELLEQAVAHLVQHETFDSQEQNKNPTQAVQDTSAANDYQMSTVEGISSKTKKKTAKDDLCKETRNMTNERIQTDAAVKIQALWRGWHIRHLIDEQTKKWLAAVTIQAAWRGYFCRSSFKRSQQVSRARKALWTVRHDAAATTIQAYYRGYRIRRILAVALQNVKSDSDDDDFNYDEEVDLSAFDFDTGVLDEGWTPTDTPQLPSRGPALPKTVQSEIQSKPRRQAWRSADSPFDQDPPQASHTRVPGINVNRSPEHDLMSVTSGAQSHMTHRAEEMSNEWGVKNVSTAELMWKRANRMKYNPARKRKLLDPTKRLALFKKLDEANKLKEVKPPPKRPPQRVDYFAAREALLKSGNTTPTSEREAKAQMTYSWVHSQGVVHQDEETNYMGFTQDFSPQTKPKIRSSSLSSKGSVSLPQLDPVQLTGRNIPLVSSPALIREQIMSNDTTPRRNSSVSEDVRFPPIKTYSVPNLAARSVASGSTSRSNEKSNSAGARMTNERRERR